MTTQSPAHLLGTLAASSPPSLVHALCCQQSAPPHLAHCITLLCLLCQVGREDTARLHHTSSISGCSVSAASYILDIILSHWMLTLDITAAGVFVGSNTGNDWSWSSVTCTCGKCLNDTQNSKLISYRFRSQQFRHFHTLIILSTQSSQSKNNLYRLQ